MRLGPLSIRFERIPSRNRTSKITKQDRILPEPYPVIELVSWQLPNGAQNFGDLLSRIIVERVLAERYLTLYDGVSRPRRLLAIGSILQFARDGDAVWGSGIHSHYPPSITRLDVRAVRGPVTWDYLRKRGISAPEVFGDPALLFPRYFPVLDGFREKIDYTFIAHHADSMLVVSDNKAMAATEPWNAILRRIVGSRLVLSSSLHGLIVAEAFGIPARYVRISENQPISKFEDYYAGTGREQFEYAKSIQEGLEMGGLNLPRFDADKLLNAFPYDLWNRQN